LIASVLNYLLAAFFLLGAGINFVAPATVRGDFERWGFPSWFHLVVSGLELAAAVLLALPAYRRFGVAIGGMAMLGAAAVVLYHGEFAHALAPGAVLVMLAAYIWTGRQDLFR
jgi:DoxX-like family